MQESARHLSHPVPSASGISQPEAPALSAEILASLPDAVLCFDQQWRITWGNSLAMRISHIGQEDLGRSHWDVFPETRGTEIEQVYRRAMDQRTREHFEFFYMPFNCWYDLTIVPDSTGGLIFYYREITEKKAVEEARDLATRRLRQLLDASTDSILVVDHEWNFRFANQQAIDLLHVGPIVGENLFTLFPGNHDEPFSSSYHRTMRDRAETSFEAFYAAPLNLWFRVLARPFEDDSIILFFSDITARKTAETARDRTLGQLNQVFDTITDGVLSLDRSWTICFLNRRARELLSPAGDILNRNLWQTFPDSLYQGSPYVEIYHRAMEQRVAGSFEAFYPAPLSLFFEVHARPSEEGIVLFFRDITASRQAASDLAEQQDLLTSIQQAAGVATWSIDLPSGAMRFGQGSAPIFGRPLASINHLDRFRELLDPRSRQALTANVEESSNSGDNSVLHEYRLLTPEGRPLWIETRAQAVLEQGRPIQLRGMAIDITRRKQEAESTEASEARYRVLVDLNPQALWSANPAGQITFANQGFLDYLGLTKARLDDWLVSFTSADHERVLKAWTDSIRSGDPYDIEARLVRDADGEARWWHLRALPVRDEAGAIVQWLGVANDIHDQKSFAETLLQLQSETERERAEIEILYKTAPIGLALFDSDDFRYLRVNDRQAAFFNLRPEQVVGQTVTELALIPGLREMFEAVARGQPVINQLLEGELASHPGEHRFWTVSYFPVYRPDGTVRAISAASLEITQQKKAEAALVQSEKLAAVGRLASSISHEINNPLEAITNLLYLTAMQDDLSEEVRGYIEMAQSELSRVSQIATQTLRFHRQAVRPTHVSARALVDAVLTLYQGRLNNSGITVDTSYTSTTPILCFENDIRQVLNNLIANAIDAMRSGGHLLARAHDTTDSRTGRPVVRLTIADTGHGMGPATLKRIFEPFYTTKDLNGTGLGLWISSGIVDRHHGRMAVRSSQHPVHHGTIFSLILPIDPPGLGQAPAPSQEILDSVLDLASDEATPLNPAPVDPAPNDPDPSAPPARG